jgi:putative aldouronate transport system substrate-binding protein
MRRKKIVSLLLSVMLLLSIVLSACSGATETAETTEEETSKVLAEADQALAEQKAAEEAAAQAQVELEAARAAEEQAKEEAEKAAAEKVEAEKLLAEAKTEEEKAAAKQLLAEKQAAEQAAAKVLVQAEQAAMAKAAAEKTAAEKAAADKATAEKAAASAKVAQTKSNTTSKPEVVSPAGVFPITKEITKLRIMVVANPLVENFNTNSFTKYLEEKTNIDIEFDVIPVNAARDKFNLVLASGNLPDVFMNFPITPAQQIIYGEIGGFLSLNEYIEKYGIETKKMIAENPYIKDLITAPDGNIYGLPHVNQCYHCYFPQKLWVYKPWLDKLGLKMPTTTEELYQVLKAFKEKDPNGNGKADEIPLAGAVLATGAQIDNFIMNAFLYSDKSRLALVNGKIDVSFNKPEWRDGLLYMRKLYEEKLIAPQTFTQDTVQFRQMGENPAAVILGAASAANMGAFTTLNGPSGRWSQYAAVPPLKGPKGFQIAAMDPWGVTSGNYVITRSAKNPEAAFRLADALYNREMTLISIFGRKDQEWRYATKDELGLEDKPAIWRRLIPLGALQNINWAQTGPSYRPNELRVGEAYVPQPGKVDLSKYLHEETLAKYGPYAVKQSQIVPPLFFTDQQATELAELQKTINDYVTQMIARFTTGDVDLDKGWEQYLNTLNGMNVKRYIEIHQKAYDATRNK